MKVEKKSTDISEQIILQWVHGTRWAITLALFKKHEKKEHLIVVIEGKKNHPYINEFNLNIKEVKAKNQINKKITSELWSEIFGSKIED